MKLSAGENAMQFLCVIRDSMSGNKTFLSLCKVQHETRSTILTNWSSLETHHNHHRQCIALQFELHFMQRETLPAKAKLIITRGCFSFNLIFFPFFLSPPLRSIINETRLTGFYFFFAIRRSCFKASPLLDRSSFSGPRFVISSRVKHFLSSHLKHCFKFSLLKTRIASGAQVLLQIILN